MDKFQLHQSGLEMLSKCGIQFERAVLNGERTPPSASMLVGTAVDRAVRRNLQNKIDFGMLLSEPEVLDTARDTVNEEWLNGVRLNEDDAEEVGQSKGDAVDAAVAMSGHHHQKAAPGLKPTHVARKWVLDIESLPIQLAGEIDVQEGLTAIRDTKTSGKSPNKDAADISLQLTTYALAVRTLDGAIPEKVALDYVVRTPKRKDLKLVTLESRRNHHDMSHLAERVYRTALLMEKGVFTPAPLSAWWCHRKYCPFHGDCRFAARPISVPVPSLESQLQNSLIQIGQGESNGK